MAGMYKRRGWIILILFGMIVSASCTVMAVSGTWNLACFYDAGTVNELIVNNGIYEGTQENEIKLFEAPRIKDMEYSWLYIRASGISNDGVNVRIGLWNSNREQKVQFEELLVNGANWIGIEGTECSKVSVQVEGKLGYSINVSNIQLRERRIEFPAVRTTAIFLLCFLIYIAISAIIFVALKNKKKRNTGREAVDLLQGIFICVGSVGEYFYRRIGRKSMQRCRIAIICGLFFYMQVISFFSLYTSSRYFKYHMYFCIVMMLLLGMLCWEQKLKKKSWSNGLARYWFLLWSIAAVSDFIVSKRFLFQGIIMIFVMGFFYFMISNQRDRMQILYDLRSALKIWMWVNLPLCILLSPYQSEIRYAGLSKNANIWAMYLVFVFAAFLSSLLDACGRKRSLVKIVVDVCVLGIILDMIVKTGSSCGLIPAMVCLVIFSVQGIKILARTKKRARTVAFLAMGMLIFTLSVYAGDSLLRSNLLKKEPLLVETSDAGEMQPVHLFSERVLAAESSTLTENRVFQKVFHSMSFAQFTSGRNYFWKAYLRETNLWGHEFAPKLWDKGVSAHNGLLAILYRYGICSVLPYVLLIAGYVREVWRFRKYRPDMSLYSMLLMFVSVALILLSMENLEFPFYYISWYCLYLPMGAFFGNGRKLTKQ